MTTPGYKKCTHCGDEMLIDAILCSHCGKIPGLNPAPAAPPSAAGRGKGLAAMGVVLCVGSLAVLAASFRRADYSALMVGGIGGFMLGTGLLLFARARGWLRR